MLISKKAEAQARQKGWTYQTGYNAGYNASLKILGRTNIYPAYSNAWWGWKAGHKDGRKERDRRQGL